MSLSVTIQQQKRKSLAMKITPAGIVAAIPDSLSIDSETVSNFIKRGLDRLNGIIQTKQEW